jgi:hypothetical protein
MFVIDFIVVFIHLVQNEMQPNIFHKFNYKKFIFEFVNRL